MHASHLKTLLLVAAAAVCCALPASAAERVTSGDIQPTWSPSGKQNAFARLVGSHIELFVMDADGSGQHALTHGAPDHVDPTWSPDGKTIAYSALREANGQTLAG